MFGDPLSVEGPSSKSRMAQSAFADQERLYLSGTVSLNRSINALGTASGNKDEVTGQGKGDIQHARHYLQAMEAEVRCMEGKDKQRYMGKMAQYKSDLSSLERAFEQALMRSNRSMPSHGRSSVNSASSTGGGGGGGRFGGGFSGGAGMPQGYGDRTLAAEESLGRSQNSLMDSHRVLAETEEIGGMVLEDMESQRESLLRSTSHVRGTDDITMRARKTLRSMWRKQISHQAVLYAVISLLVFLIGALLVYKIRRK